MGSFFDLLFPPRCPICDGVRFSGEPVLCPGCESRVSYIREPSCMCCGRPILNEDREFCYDCQKRERSYIGGVALGTYEGALRESVLRFKYDKREEYARWYAQTLYERNRLKLTRLRADAIIPVPMHPLKERKRGYNQAASFARELGACLDVPVLEGVLIRARKTEPQKGLNDVARLQNLLSAFAVDGDKLSEWKKDHPFERVILVDDIYTTGTTMEACARLLKQAGVLRVSPVTVAVASGFAD